MTAGIMSSSFRKKPTSGRCCFTERHTSDVDERARLLHHYPLHQCRRDAERLADLQYARATLVEARDTLF
jgi:hypothetical protein